MLLQSRILVRYIHLKVSPAVSVGSACCVLGSFSSDISVCWPSLDGHVSLCTQRSAQTLLSSALCFGDYCQRFV